MKTFIILLISHVMFFISSFTYAQNTIVSRNVHVLQNATQTQCSNYHGGYAGEDNVQTFSRFGSFTGTSGAGIQTCQDCAVDPSSNDCVCRICYDRFN